jgi:hypothetical protein
MATPNKDQLWTFSVETNSVLKFPILELEFPILTSPRGVRGVRAAAADIPSNADGEQDTGA